MRLGPARGIGQPPLRGGMGPGLSLGSTWGSGVVPSAAAAVAPQPQVTPFGIMGAPAPNPLYQTSYGRSYVRKTAFGQ